MTIDADARREQVLAALVTAGDAGISGQTLADDLGCSRAAIHRHVETLRRSGTAIDGVHDGYRLGAGADPVVPLLVTGQLQGPIRGPVRWAPRTGSTNDDAVAAARAGAPEGLVIGADFQTAGRGRLGRAWRAEPGEALLVSVVLRPGVPATEVGIVPILAAVAVAAAIGDGAGIVWPNDVVVEDRKVCGILSELAADEAGVAWVVVGFGLNVAGAPRVADARWTPGAISGPGHGPRRSDLLVALLNGLGREYAEWRDAGPAGALGRFLKRDRLAGQGITVRSGDREIAGTAAGVDDAGRLRVRTASGETAVAAGEVLRVERADGA